MNGAMLAPIGRFTAGFAAGDLSGALPDMERLAVALPGVLSEAVALTLLQAGRAEQAREAWAARRPVQRDYFWLVTTTLRAHAAVRLGDLDVARACARELRPWAGRVAGLESGTLVVGPVDDALAAVAEAVGDPEAQAHREGAAALRRDLRAQLTVLDLQPDLQPRR